MNRDQAQAVLHHLDLIQHYAAGGDIGHRMYNCRGEFLYTSATKNIILGNLHVGEGTYYVKVKPRFTFNREMGMWERKPRYWPEKIREEEIIKDCA